MSIINLPALRSEYEPTRASLHAYAKAIEAVITPHAIAHPKLWHISFTVRPEGLISDPVPLPGGGSMGIGIDLKRHHVSIRASSGAEYTVELRDAPTATALGSAIIAVASELGLADRYKRERYESDEPREYETAAAEAYFDAFVNVATVFQQHRVTLGDRVGPVQLWPHGFDLAFEWFGTRTEQHGDDVLPAQLNLGFYPADDRPYFYSNPWPFDESLTRTALPHGATWHTEGWMGTMLPYDLIQGDPEAASKLLDYARTVFRAARPTLE